MRTTALLAAGAAALHVWMVAAHGASHGLWAAGALVIMTALCARCAVGLWRHRGDSCRRELVQLQVMSLAMVVVHALLLFGIPGGGHGHQHGGMSHGAGPVAAPMYLMMASIPVELAVAAAAGFTLRRLRRAAPDVSRGAVPSSPRPANAAGQLS